MRNLIIYRNKLLPASETFVLNQAESLCRFKPYYAGSSRCSGLQTPSDRTLVLHSGGLLGKALECMQYPAALAKQIEGLQPALVHAHFGPDGFKARALANALGVPLVVTFHGYDVTTKDHVARSSFRAFRRYVDGRSKLQQEGALFIAVSKFIRDLLIEQGFPKERTVVHYVGVDTAAPSPNDARDVQAPIVLFVGRLVPNKGCEYLIRAMSGVSRTVRNARLCVIGDGRCRASLESEAKSAGCDVTFLGSQPPEVDRSWMRKASVLCAPSIAIPTGPSEGFGLVLIEAQALALPVVAFETGGIPEAVQHGATGFLAPQGNVSKLAEYLALLLADKTLAETFGRNGTTYVRERFDLKQQTKLLENLYDSVLKNCAATAA